VGFEATISAGERPQDYALDRSATEIGSYQKCYCEIRRQALFNCTKELQFL
jgi:hypothetical protein